MELSAAARVTDIALATGNRFWVIRADVAGENGKLKCFECSEIVDPQGHVIRAARPRATELLAAEIDAENR